MVAALFQDIHYGPRNSIHVKFLGVTTFTEVSHFTRSFTSPKRNSANTLTDLINHTFPKDIFIFIT